MCDCCLVSSLCKGMKSAYIYSHLDNYKFALLSGNGAHHLQHYRMLDTMNSLNTGKNYHPILHLLLIIWWANKPLSSHQNIYLPQMNSHVIGIVG